MNERFSDELLSAWLDGELSLPERAAVERWLEQSPEARQSLEELQRVSSLVRSLPVATPSDDLLPSIMRQAEREVLIPGAPGREQSRSRRRAWIVAGGGLAVTAAAVLLMVSVFYEPGTRQPEQLAQNARTLHRSDEMGADAAASAPREPGDRTTAGEALAFSENESLNRQYMDAPVQDPELSVRENSAGGAAGASPSGAGAGTAARSLTEAQELRSESGAAAVAGAQVRGREELSLAKVPNWGSLQIGDVVPYFENSGDRVAVVEMTVVDVRQAVDTLQVLLTKNAVPPVVYESQRSESDDAMELLEGVHTANGHLAVYVESTDDQLASTLREIETNEVFNGTFLGCSLKPPVPLDDVELAAVEEPVQEESAVRNRKAAITDLKRETLKDAADRNRLLQYQSRGAKEAELARTDASESTVDAAKPPPSLGTELARKTRSDRKDAKPEALSRSAAGARGPRPATASEPLAAGVPSFQMLVNVPLPADELGRSSERLNTPAPGMAAPGPPLMEKKRFAFSAGADSMPGQPGQTVPDPSAVRVIFIFRDQDMHTEDG